MKLFYIANVKIPTERAHGLQIMKMCEAFAAAGHEVELLVPRRLNKIKASSFDFYGVKNNFKIKKIFCLDLMRFDFYFGNWVFWVQSFSFLMAVGIYLGFSSVGLIYSREAFSGLIFGRLVLEIHSFPAKIRPWQKRIWRRARAIFVLTNLMKDDLAREGVPPDKIAVAPDGVDLEKFDLSLTKQQARLAAGLPLDKKIVLYCGTFYFYGWKGVDVFLEAAKIADAEILFLLVGGGGAAAAQIKEKYNLPNIRLAGRRPHKEVPIYLKAADILILPNKSGDRVSEKYTSPLKLFEYMAAKRPIVASDLPSIREILNENNAVLVAPDSPQALIEGVNKLLADPDLSDKIARRAFSEVKEKYTWRQRAKEIINFIEKN